MLPSRQPFSNTPSRTSTKGSRNYIKTPPLSRPFASWDRPILAYPQFQGEPFILDTDFSADRGAIGGVLSQVQDGQERVIAYGARRLLSWERSYASTKGELLAVIFFLQYYKYYLLHRPFILRTDNRALTWIRSLESPTGMILRWLEILAQLWLYRQAQEGNSSWKCWLSVQGASRRSSFPERGKDPSKRRSRRHRCPPNSPRIHHRGDQRSSGKGWTPPRRPQVEDGTALWDRETITVSQPEEAPCLPAFPTSGSFFRSL